MCLFYIFFIEMNYHRRMIYITLSEHEKKSYKMGSMFYNSDYFVYLKPKAV